MGLVLMVCMQIILWECAHLQNLASEMQRPGENICDLQQVQYFLTLSGHLHSFTGSTGALLAPLWLSHTAAVLCTRVTLCLEAAPCHGGSLQPWCSAGVWVKKHCVLLPWAGLSHLTHTHCSFAQLPDFLSRKRHLGHTSPCTKKSRGCAFALRHFGYMHLGFSQSALPWRVFFSWLQL